MLYKNNEYCSAELYDSSTGLWTNTGNTNGARSFHAASILTNGKLLIIGEYNMNGEYCSSTE